MTNTDRTRIAADWAKRGFGCDLWVDPPGQRWEDFTHATDELEEVESAIEGVKQVRDAAREQLKRLQQLQRDIKESLRAKDRRSK